MASMRSHTQKIRNQIAAGNMGKLADETLKAAVANHGFWGDEWCELFDTLRDLPVEERRRLAHAFIEHFQSLGEEPETRQRVLTLLGIIAHDLPDDFFLPTERLAELETLGARHSYWHATRLDLLAEAELATGRQLAPSVVAVFRRTALVAYRSEHLVELVKKLTTPVLNVGEAWADQAMEQLTGSDDDPWQALLLHALTATASKPSAKWDKQAQALIDSHRSGPGRADRAVLVRPRRPSAHHPAGTPVVRAGRQQRLRPLQRQRPARTRLAALPPPAAPRHGPGPRRARRDLPQEGRRNGPAQPEGRQRRRHRALPRRQRGRPRRTGPPGHPGDVQEHGEAARRRAGGACHRARPEPGGDRGARRPGVRAHRGGARPAPARGRHRPHRGPRHQVRARLAQRGRQGGQERARRGEAGSRR